MTKTLKYVIVYNVRETKFKKQSSKKLEKNLKKPLTNKTLYDTIYNVKRRNQAKQKNKKNQKKCLTKSQRYDTI